VANSIDESGKLRFRIDPHSDFRSELGPEERIYVLFRDETRDDHHL